MTALVSLMVFVRAAAAGKDHRRSGRNIIRPVMLAQTKDIEPDLIGEFDFLDQMPHPLLALPPAPLRRLGMNVAKCVKTKFHGVLPVSKAVRAK